MTREVLAFADGTLAVEAEGVVARRIMHVLFRRVARALDATPLHTLSLRTDDASHTPGSLALDGKTLFRSADPGDLAEHAQAEAAYHLIDGCYSGAAVHAGAVSCEGRALLLPAQSGSGKSTLTAWLTALGFVHHSDELVHLPASGASITGWQRPIELKRGGRAVIETTLGTERPESSWLETPTGCMVHPELLGPGKSTPSGELSAIVFPRYRNPAASLELRPLSQAEASSMLLQCTLNARHLKGHGLHDCAAWARRVPAFSLSYGGFAGVEDVLRTCLALAR